MHLRAGASDIIAIYLGNWIADAMANRLQAIATPLVSNMDKVQIIPPPKGVDPRVLVWKGAAVLGKMDGVSDLWLTATEWVSIRSGSPMHALTLTHPCRTSWGYGAFANAASTYDPHSACEPSAETIQLVNCVVSSVSRLTCDKEQGLVPFESDSCCASTGTNECGGSIVVT
jgi:hypothetical protein